MYSMYDVGSCVFHGIQFCLVVRFFNFNTFYADCVLML